MQRADTLSESLVAHRRRTQDNYAHVIPGRNRIPWSDGRQHKIILARYHQSDKHPKLTAENDLNFVDRTTLNIHLATSE